MCKAQKKISDYLAIRVGCFINVIFDIKDYFNLGQYLTKSCGEIFWEELELDGWNFVYKEF